MEHTKCPKCHKNGILNDLKKVYIGPEEFIIICADFKVKIRIII